MRSSCSRRRCLRALCSTGPPKAKPRPQGRWISSQSPLLSAAIPTRYIKLTSPLNTSPPNSQRPNSSLSTIEYNPSNNDLHPITTAYGQPSTEGERVLLDPDNLFHSFSHSPSPEMRRRAAFIKKHAYCPHPSHYRTREPNAPDDPEGRKPISTATNAAKTPTRVVAAGLIDSHSLSRDPLRRLSTSELPTQAVPPAHVRFECPDCGVPVSCCQEHWEDDYESHLEICDTLRQINEDDHDLRSGRFFPEFDYPEPQRAEEFIINMSNWDTFLYTRDFTAIDDPRHMRQVTKLLTYPITIATVLHELSPYSIRSGGRLTNEGLRSLSALRYTLHPPRSGEGPTIAGLRPRPPPTRLFILGARAESSLPREVWVQLTHCFPRSAFHVIFIGPESMTNREGEFPLPPRTAVNPFGGVVEARLTSQMKITTFVEYFHTMHTANYFAPYDPYFDVFVLFHPGLGHPASSHEWKATVPMMLETKCPIICTGYTEWDMERDRRWVEEQVGGEMDILLEPGENLFRSLRWDLNDLDPGDVSCGNWGLWAFRGKRYEATYKEAER